MSTPSFLPQEEIHASSFSYNCSLLQGLVSESANLLVLRVMARRQTVPQDAIFLSFDDDHHICTATYVRVADRYKVHTVLGALKHLGNIWGSLINCEHLWVFLYYLSKLSQHTASAPSSNLPKCNSHATGNGREIVGRKDTSRHRTEGQ